MRRLKVISKLILMSFVFFMFDFTIVEAENKVNDATMCIGGYTYYFDVYQLAGGATSYDYSKMVNKITAADLAKNSSKEQFEALDKNETIQTWRKYTDAEGNIFKYYQSGSLKSQCYTHLTEKKPTTIVTTENGLTTTINSKEYIVHVKQCGNIYGNDVYFEKNTNIKQKLLNEYIEKSYDSSIETNFIQDDGTITLKLRPSEITANKLNKKDIWNRLTVSVEYNGGASKGNCTVSKFTDDNGTFDPVITCNNISPYKASVDANNNITNNSTYKIYLYIEGPKIEDFPETDVTDATKQDYLNSCGGSKSKIYLGYITTSIIPEDAIAIPNPKDTDPELKKLCYDINSFTEASTESKKALIPECYEPKLTIEQYNNQKELIEKKFEQLKDMYSGISSNTYLADVAKSEEGLLCTDMVMGIPSDVKENEVLPLPFQTKTVYEETGEYWGIVCTEAYYVDGGVPSLVAAGTGVEYSNKVQIDKTCSIFQRKEVTKKVQCQHYSNTYIRFDHGNDGIVNDGDTNGGPNSLFDSCIESCDGGQYTQKCINSCYSSSYSDSRSELISDVTESNFDFSKKYKTTKIAEQSTNGAQFNEEITGTGTYTFDGGSVVVQQGAYNEGDFHGSPNDWIITVYDDQTPPNVLDQAGSSAACNANLTVFTDSYSGPPGCVNTDPDEDYYTEMSKSQAELSKFKALASADSQVEEYSISLTDTTTGYVYKVTGTTTKEINTAQLIINKDTNLSKTNVEEKNNYNLGDSGNATQDGKETIISNQDVITKRTVTTVYNVELPIAHTKIDEPEVIVVENNEKTTATYFDYQTTTRDEKTEIEYYVFKPYNNYNSALFRNGEKAYYTNIHSPFYNVRINPGETEEDLASLTLRDYVAITENGKKTIYELVNNKENIEVAFTIGGHDATGNYTYNEYKKFDSSGFDCYYGVYPFVFPDPECVGEHCDPSPTPTPTGGGDQPSSGLRYYYREIDLNDVFPNNRNPRWNWTGTIKGNEVTGAANKDDLSYIVDPEKLIEDIETKGESIYNDTKELDYEFVMTTDIINTIRKYNNSNITYLDFSLVGNVKDKKNYSQKIKDWYDGLYGTAYAITECNNAISGTCDTN